jgi:hypothetical protein
MGKILSERLLGPGDEHLLPPPSIFTLPSFRKSAKEETKTKDAETFPPPEKPNPPKPENGESPIQKKDGE